MTVTAGARRRLDSESDVETRVFKRPPPLGLDRTMILQIMKELDPQRQKAPPPPARPARVVPSRIIPVRAPVRAPNVFLTPRTPADPLPPWEPLADASASGSRPRVRIVRSRTKLPYFAGVLSFALAFAVLNDPVVRRDTTSQITGAAKDVRSSAMRLWRFVSRILT